LPHVYLFSLVDDGRVNWYDLDMPPVVELCHQFFTESERHHMITASVTDLEWVDTGASDGRPVLPTVACARPTMHPPDPRLRRSVVSRPFAFAGSRWTVSGVCKPVAGE
jgi:hypothetical protein